MTSLKNYKFFDPYPHHPLNVQKMYCLKTIEFSNIRQKSSPTTAFLCGHHKCIALCACKWYFCDINVSCIFILNPAFFKVQRRTMRLEEGCKLFAWSQFHGENLIFLLYILYVYLGILLDLFFKLKDLLLMVSLCV